MPAKPFQPLPSAQAQAEKMIDAWVARNLETEDGVERRRRAADAARRLVQLALSLEPALAAPASQQRSPVDSPPANPPPANTPDSAP